MAPSPSGQTPVSGSAPAPAAADAGAIEDWVLARLRSPERPLLPLERDALDVDALRHGALAGRAFRVEDPTLWLLVFRFDRQSGADAAREAISKALDDGPPYSTRTSITGAYLLVAGFASHKPVSPEMERVQTQYLSAFAGEE